MTADVTVVGGGPAGLAAAIAVARQNLRVVVLESGQPPLDKACGEGLMPDALAILRDLGVTLAPGAGVEFRGIRFVSGGLQAVGSFAEATDHLGLGVRRTALHAALVLAAERSGVDLRFGVAAHGLAPGGIETAFGLVPSRFVVGADGLHSRVGVWAGLRRQTGPRARFGLRRHFARAPWTDRVEVHWGNGAEAYVTPVGAQEVGVALLWSGARPSFEDLPERFPTLAPYLAGASPTTRVRGAGPFDQRVPSVIGRAAMGSVVLLGDAAGYVDAITGEGIAIALHEAVALAPALAAGDLAAYGRASRRLRRLPEAITRLLLAAERRPVVRDRLIALLASDPRVFSRLLAVQTRRLPARRLGAVTLLRLAACWRPPSGDRTATIAV